MVPDYYEMLGVEMGADRAAIDAALARAQPIWSAGTRNPKSKHTYQSYLDQIPQIKRALLGDASARIAYDAELTEARRREQEQRLDRLKVLVRLRAAKGGLTVGDRALLRDETASIGLEPGELDQLIQSIPPVPDAPADADSFQPVADVLDNVTRRQIRLVLEHLQRRDLYDLLDLPRDAPQRELVTRADELRSRWMRKSQVTADKTAWLEAVSYAISHLGQQAPRARYDRTLLDDAELEFDALVQFTLRQSRRLDNSTVRVLLDEASRLGVGPARAEGRINNACRTHGIPRDTGGSGPDPSPSKGAARAIRCRSCSGLTDFHAVAQAPDHAACRHCRASLRWTCPVCQKSSWMDEPRCACGFRLEWREPMVRNFEAAQYCYKMRDFVGALEHLTRVQDFAPHHIGTRKGIEKIRERIAEIDTARSQFQTEWARRHLVAARAALEHWKRLDDPARPELRAAWTDLVRALSEAYALATRAGELVDKDSRSARDLFRQSLSRCADLPEAIEGLRRCPPEPPTDLRVEPRSGRLLLAWSASHPDGLGPVLYRVVRKSESTPSSFADGETVAEVAQTQWLDHSARDGQRYGYAVFAVRQGTLSRKGAVAEPTLFLSEVTGLRAESASGQVTLRWHCPPGAFAVKVVRRRGAPPRGPDDGQTIESSRDEAIDRGLENEQVYHYAVFARYQLSEGRLASARGVVIAAVPSSVPIDPPSLALDPTPRGEMRLVWTPPARGETRIASSAVPLPFGPGARITAEQASALDVEWLVSSQAGTVDPLPKGSPTQPVCYTPCLFWSGHAFIGSPVHYLWLEDPRDLSSGFPTPDGRLLLRWRWSPGCRSCLLMARMGRPPLGPDDPQALRHVITDRDYAREGHCVWHLPHTGGAPWHIQIYGEAMVEGHLYHSPGREPTSRLVISPNPAGLTVNYRLRRPRFLLRPWSIEFKTDPPNAKVPATVLVAHARTVPLSVDDGDVVASIPGAVDGASVPFRPYHKLNGERLRLFLDPSSDPESTPHVRFRHPGLEGTRV